MMFKLLALIALLWLFAIIQGQSIPLRGRRVRNVLGIVKLAAVADEAVGDDKAAVADKIEIEAELLDFAFFLFQRTCV